MTPDPKIYLGRSQKGVYCALDDYYVYILEISFGKMEWVRKASILASDIDKQILDLNLGPYKILTMASHVMSIRIVMMR